MSNELVVAGDTGANLPITQADVDSLIGQRKLFMQFVESQLRPEIDAGTIPGTDKPSLYQPGAQKLERLFALGHKFKRTGEIFDRDTNFMSYTYRCSVYSLRRPDVIIAECEGTCNSQEKKYRERKIYEWKNGKKECTGTEATPICDVSNTIMKMSQKRAYVGAILAATAASDFYTQDVEDGSDAESVGMDTERKPTARAKVVVPKATAARSDDQSGSAKSPVTPNSTASQSSQPAASRNRGTIAREIFETSKALGMTPGQVDAKCTEAFGVSRMSATDDQLEQLAEFLKANFEAKKGTN